jgi:hypothetical protein
MDQMSHLAAILRATLQPTCGNVQEGIHPLSSASRILRFAILSRTVLAVQMNFLLLVLEVDNVPKTSLDVRIITLVFINTRSVIGMLIAQMLLMKSTRFVVLQVIHSLVREINFFVKLITTVKIIV